MRTVECIECAREIEVGDDLLLGEILMCPDCGVELEVMALEPVTVDLAPELEEDWGE